jgi:hypothetical protein
MLPTRSRSGLRRTPALHLSQGAGMGMCVRGMPRIAHMCNAPRQLPHKQRASKCQRRHYCCNGRPRPALNSWCAHEQRVALRAPLIRR